MTNKIILTNNFKKSSIANVDGVSYMPKASYETFPALPIYTSTDGTNWELLTHVFKDNSILNLTGIDASAGFWSPSLSFDGKKYYMVYSLVKSFGGNNLNVDNFVMSATNLMKKWSEPIYLNSNKASSILVHAYGVTYLVSLRINIETEYEPTRAIVIQEYNTKKGILVGDEIIIAKPVARGDLFSELSLEEVNGIYHLTLVEYSNGKRRTTVLTSGEITSMFHVLKFDDDIEFKSKPKPKEKGKEKLDKSKKEKDDKTIETVIEVKDVGEVEEQQVTVKAVDNHVYLDSKYDTLYTLREGANDSWFKQAKIEGGNEISLRGRNSLSSKFDKSFIGKLITTKNYTFETKLFFKPENIYQSAGVACYYDNDNYYYLRLYKSETFGGLTIGITSSQNGEKFEILHHGIKLGENINSINLKLTKYDNKLQFHYNLFNGNSWTNVSTPIDVSTVEVNHDGVNLVGMTVQDQSNKSAWATFQNIILY